MSKKIFKWVFISLIITTIVFVVFAFNTPGSTPAIKGADRKPLAGSIAALEQVELGGVKQWVLMRGYDTSKPVLLILHGGPGSPEMPMVRAYNSGLEKNFIVVNWDQRGAGKSYSKSIKPETMKIALFVSDAEELVNYLRKRFNKDKIYIEGHSWGSALGTLLVQKIPQYVKAYIAVGQVSNMIESEKNVYNYVLAQAQAKGDKKAMKELESAKSLADGDLKKIMVQRKWSMKYGGLIYKDPMKLLSGSFSKSPEYSLRDALINYYSGSKLSLYSMWDELVKGDMFTSAAVWKVPVYFIIGRHDTTIDPYLAEKYFNYLKAPKKKFFWFENSSHMAAYEEPEKYENIMVNTVLIDNEVPNKK